MEKMKIVEIVDNGFILESKEEPKCRCTISNLRFHDTQPIIQTEVVWHSEGKYTNGQRKKMLARTVVSLLRSAVEHQKKLDKHSKGKL